MSFVIQLTRNWINPGNTSPKCAKLNGKEMSNHAEPTIQNSDAISSGGRERFLLPVMNWASGPTVPMRTEPYKKNASVGPKEEVKKPVDHAWCA
jgi:hypothetical protein